MNIQGRIRQVEDPNFKAKDGELLFAPSLFICPSSVLGQFYTTAKKFFPSYYRIISLFQNKHTADSDRAADTVTFEELKAHMESLKTNHEDPQVRISKASRTLT